MNFELGALYSVFMLEDVASDKRLDVGLLSLHSALRLFCKGLTVDFEEVSGIASLFGKPGAGKTTTLLSFLAQFLAGAPRLPGRC